MNEKIKWLRNKLLGLNMQGIIITNPVNIRYLTNIKADGIFVVNRKENIFILFSPFYFNQIKAAPVQRSVPLHLRYLPRNIHGTGH